MILKGIIRSLALVGEDISRPETRVSKLGTHFEQAQIYSFRSFTYLFHADEVKNNRKLLMVQRPIIRRFDILRIVPYILNLAPLCVGRIAMRIFMTSILSMIALAIPVGVTADPVKPFVFGNFAWYSDSASGFNTGNAGFEAGGGFAFTSKLGISMSISRSPEGLNLSPGSSSGCPPGSYCIASAGKLIAPYAPVQYGPVTSYGLKAWMRSNIGESMFGFVKAGLHYSEVDVSVEYLIPVIDISIQIPELAKFDGVGPLLTVGIGKQLENSFAMTLSYTYRGGELEPEASYFSLIGLEDSVAVGGSLNLGFELSL